MNTRRAARLGTIAALLGFCSIIFVPLASAHPANVVVSCSSGAGTYRCNVQYTGAHDPTTIRWYQNGVHMSHHDNKKFVFQQGCQVNASYTLRAVVTDVHGSAEGSEWFICWPRQD